MASSTGNILSGAASASSQANHRRLAATRHAVDSTAVPFTPFTDLVVGGDNYIKTMICRGWDVKSPFGKYIGTEYIISDEQGNALHCVARSSISHCVVPKLKVGHIYSISRFTVAPNKTTYRVRADDQCLIQLEGNTVIQPLECPSDGFLRHPFCIKSIEEITFNGSKYLIDAIGRVINVGAVKATTNGSQYLHLNIINQRGRKIKVTLWGCLCDKLIACATPTEAVHIIILTAMNVRDYKGELQLTSTSGTILYDTDDIAEIQSLRAVMSDKELPAAEITGTLLELLLLGREQNGVPTARSRVFNCKVQIKKILPRNSWNYYSCGQGGCRKGVNPVDNYFWCDSCERRCDYPLLRYRLQLEVIDSTTALVVTVFDDLAETLVGKTATLVMNGLGEDDHDIEIPSDILLLEGKSHVFELKTHTYYNHGQYESFTATAVHPVSHEEKVLTEITTELTPKTNTNSYFTLTESVGEKLTTRGPDHADPNTITPADDNSTHDLLGSVADPRTNTSAETEEPPATPNRKRPRMEDTTGEE